jgi:hypothetical protein
MWNRTGQYLAAERQARHLTLGQLARAIGYTHVSKGAQRILALERENVTVPGLIDRMIQALGLNPVYVQSLVEEDRRAFAEEWERWASEPVEPELRFRPFAGLWCGTSLPKGLTHEAAIAYARQRAMTTARTYVLVWSRKEEVWCYPDGRTGTGIMEVGDVAGPCSTLTGGRGFIFG